MTGFIPPTVPTQGVLPPIGQHDGVCLGWKDAPNRPDGQPCLRLRYQLTTRDANGRRFVVSKKFTRTLESTSALKYWLEHWQGEKFKHGDLVEGLWLEALKGRPAVLTVAHWTSPAAILYPVLTAITPWDYRQGPAPTIEVVENWKPHA